MWEANNYMTYNSTIFKFIQRAAQPTTSVDTSSWFDQGAGGGQPKDVSSLFADDAQASQAPPPVAQVLGLVCA